MLFRSRRDLESAIVNLQLGPLASRVHAILDRHLASLPKGSKRDQSDLVWQLAIQRMDLRQYTVSETTEAPLPSVNTAGKESATTYVRFEPKVTDPDVQAMVEQNAAKFSAMSNLLALWMWGVKAFKGEITPEERAGWRGKLAEARVIDREREDDLGARNGPGVVAAVCVRDHWDEIGRAYV